METQVKTPSYPELPTDVMMEIFRRLPARSVGRFRTVSKQYYWLLSRPSFIKDHLLHGGGVTSTKLIVHTIKTDPRKNRYFHYPLDNNLTGDNYSCNEFVFDTNYVFLLGSCNGLFCIIDREAQRLTLWNPTTKKFDGLPQLPDTKLDNHYSFGYDSVNDDYKIVCVTCVSNKASGETPLSNTTYMYSHTRRRWKEIEQAFPPCCIQYSYDGNSQFVHGKVHWVAYTSLDEKGIKRSQFIVSLDLATEKYGIVPRPSSDHPGDDLSVCVFGGELCFYINSDYMYGRGFEMWIMREYGVEKSWFQLLTIPLHNLQYCNSKFYHRQCVPLFLMKSGEILLKAFEWIEFREAIYLYNPKNCNFITVNTVFGNACLAGHIYVESLVETAISNKVAESSMPSSYKIETECPSYRRILGSNC